MPEWITPVSAIVQAACIVILVGLTGWYAYWVKRQVSQDREFFERKAAQASELVKRQARQYNERERQQVDRTIQTIASELELNIQKEKWKFQESPPLLNTAYASNLWAVQLIGMSPTTFRALGDVYLSVQRYNLLYAAATEAQKPQAYRTNATQIAWSKAQAAINKALKELREDPATAPLVSSRVGNGPERMADV